jgi:hypothetical protein
VLLLEEQRVLREVQRVQPKVQGVLLTERSVPVEVHRFLREVQPS